MLLKLNFDSLDHSEYHLWGHVFEPQNDIEKLKSKPEKAHGEYALIYKSAKGQWSVIRDKVGIQPIYYSIHDTNQVWVSDSYGELLKAIESPKIDSQHIKKTRDYNFKDKVSTACLQIKRAMPASITHFKSSGINTETYWRPSHLKVIKYSEKEWLDKTHQIFDQIIREKLKEPEKFGVLWSGGIDSTAIVLKASEYTDKASAFSFTCDDPNLTGGQLNDKIKSQSQLQHIDFAFESKPLDYYFPKTDEAQNGILYSPAHILGSRKLFQQAKEKGINWMVHGHGPDYLFDPPFTYWSLSSWPRDLKAFSKALFVYSHNFGKKEALKEFLKVLFFKLPKNLQKVVLKKYRPELSNTSSDLRFRYLETILLHNGGLQHGLEQMQELAHMYDIKLTFPYFDTRFLELAILTPLELLWGNKQTKPAFRLFASQFIPQDIAEHQTTQDYRYFSLKILSAFQKAFWPDELPKQTPMNENIDLILSNYNFWETKKMFGEHHEKEKNL